MKGHHSIAAKAHLDRDDNAHVQAAERLEDVVVLHLHFDHHKCRRAMVPQPEFVVGASAWADLHLREQHARSAGPATGRRGNRSLIIVKAPYEKYSIW